jgi:hypothetical protein
LKKDAKFADKLVPAQAALKLKDELGLLAALECSALSQDGLKEVFDDAARAAVGSLQASESKSPTSTSPASSAKGSSDKAAAATGNDQVRKKRRCTIV